MNKKLMATCFKIIVSSFFIACIVVAFGSSINSYAKKVSKSEYHVSDKEWNKAKKLLKKNNPNMSDKELESMRGEYEASQYEKKYGEQIKIVKGVKYLYKNGKPLKNKWFNTYAKSGHGRYMVRSDSKGRLIVNKWKKIKGNKYHFDKNGYMATGWKKIGNNWYFFDNTTGIMKSDGWVRMEDHSWYYFNKNGSMKTGWLNDGGSWYYLNNNGQYVTGKQTIDGKTYEFSDDGILK